MGRRLDRDLRSLGHSYIVRGNTETSTLTGRRRTSVTKLTERLNSPMQGTGVDGLKLALTYLWERRHECSGGFIVSDSPYFRDRLDFLTPGGDIYAYWDHVDSLLPFLREEAL